MPGRQYHIFYCDDDEDDLDIFEQAVAELKLNYNVHLLKGAEALYKMLDHPPPEPSVLFLDINMRGINGFEVLRTVHQSEEHARLRIIMLSTASDQAVIDASRKQGASGYMVKPANYLEFVDLLRKVLGNPAEISNATSPGDTFTLSGN